MTCRRSAGVRFALPPLALMISLLAGTDVASGMPASPTPVAGDAPPPELCQAEARRFDELDALARRGPAGTPQTSRTTDVLPAGEPADAATVAAVTATVRELVACWNAGELLRAYGLYTDDGLAALFARQGSFSRAAYDGLATPQPAPAAERAAILAIEDVRRLPDGTVGATVTIRYAVVPMPKRFFFTFAYEDGRWLIADVLGEITFAVP